MRKRLMNIRRSARVCQKVSARASRLTVTPKASRRLFCKRAPTSASAAPARRGVVSSTGTAALPVSCSWRKLSTAISK